jgi:crotonobetainyl-CoA:carnitine CoA-transferase CaiB-like acyl-CoA transferase
VRVLDLTRVLAGPFATLLLADLGAEVWKVEHPDGGDETRQIPPAVGGESHYFASINRNKKSVAIDLKDPRGRALALDLAARADVVVENFRPGVAERLGLAYDQLSGSNPRLVYCSISAFGQTGPWADRTAFDVSVQALSGLMSLTGEPGGAPARAGLPMADLTAGLMAVVGILSALVERDRSGRGQVVDTSMLDSMVGMLTYLAGRWFMTGEDVSRVGSGHPSAVPYGAYPTADGYIVLATLYESYWPVLCRAVGRADLAANPAFATNEQRLARRAEVDAELAAALRTRTTAAWEEAFRAVDLPAAPILTVGQVLTHPQVAARGLVHEVDHPSLGPTQVVGPTIAFSRSASPTPSPAPLLGQDTAEVLSSVLGLEGDEITRLVGDGVVMAPTSET